MPNFHDSHKITCLLYWVTISLFIFLRISDAVRETENVAALMIQRIFRGYVSRRERMFWKPPSAQPMLLYNGANPSLSNDSQSTLPSLVSSTLSGGYWDWEYCYDFDCIVRERDPVWISAPQPDSECNDEECNDIDYDDGYDWDGHGRYRDKEWAFLPSSQVPPMLAHNLPINALEIKEVLVSEEEEFPVGNSLSLVDVGSAVSTAHSNEMVLSCPVIITTNVSKCDIFGNTVFRQGQSKFRDDVLARCNNRCVVTGVRVLCVLQAAHIFPYKDKDKLFHLGLDIMDAANGIALRADLHILFDNHSLWVCKDSDGTLRWQCSDSAAEYLPEVYNKLCGDAFSEESMRFLNISDHIDPHCTRA